MAKKNTGGLDAEKVRLLADRLCWLEKGQDGLRWRNGMWRSDRSYRDRYDLRAEKLLSGGQNASA